MKTDPSIAYMVPDRKQKFLQIRYCEGKVYYFGKKDMNLLVMMEVRWKVDGKISVFEYSFVDCFIKGNSC